MRLLRTSTTISTHMDLQFAYTFKEYETNLERIRTYLCSSNKQHQAEDGFVTYALVSSQRLV